jgi:hypothetical protein
MTKTIIILLVLFALCCNTAKEQQREQDAQEPTMLTGLLKVYDTVSCPELTDKKSEEEEKKPSRRERCDKDKYCLEIKTHLRDEFDVRYKMLKNDAQYHIENDGKAEKDNLKKIESIYEKRFGISISDFERLIKHIDFYIGGYGAFEFTNDNSDRYSLSLFSVTKTATGAIVKYKRNEFIEPIELELNINEWVDFIRVLYVSCINKWEKEDDDFYVSYCDFYNPNKIYRKQSQWKLEIFSSDKKEPDEYYGIQVYTPNFKMLKEAIDIIKIRMYREAMIKMEPQLKIDYQKRFGEPITYMELSTVHIYYYHYIRTNGTTHFLATRTTSGGFVECQSSNKDWFVADLDKNEWLDFIRALHKNIKVWNEWLDTTDRGFRSAAHINEVKQWHLRIYPLGRVTGYDTNFQPFPLDRWVLPYGGYYTRRTAMDRLMEQPFAGEFISLMADMTEKVKMKDKLNRK